MKSPEEIIVKVVETMVAAPEFDQYQISACNAQVFSLNSGCALFVSPDGGWDYSIIRTGGAFELSIPITITIGVQSARDAVGTLGNLYDAAHAAASSILANQQLGYAASDNIHVQNVRVTKRDLKSGLAYKSRRWADIYVGVDVVQSGIPSGNC
jgi:hypothetical protein